MQNTKQQVRDFYDRIGWSHAGDGLYQNARYEDLRPVSQEYIHACHQRVSKHIASRGRFMLDAGSGPVQWPDYLEYSKSFDYRVCTDISRTALQEARSRLLGRGLYVVADIANLPFRGESFDAAISMHAIHHLPLREHRQAYIELHRTLRAGSTAVAINGWHNPLLMRIAEPFIRIGRVLAGRSSKLKKDYTYAEDSTGTFVEKMTPRWLRQELRGIIDFQVYPWRSLSPRVMRWFIRPGWAGHALLRVVFLLEEAFPAFFGEYGQYPMIVIRKRP